LGKRLEARKSSDRGGKRICEKGQRKEGGAKPDLKEEDLNNKNGGKRRGEIWRGELPRVVEH